MKFDDLDDNYQGDLALVGKTTSRIDGPLKTSGLAPYAYERHDVTGPQLVAYPVGAAIAKGRIASIDADAARSAPGVVDVILTTDVKPLPLSDWNTASLFGGAEVQHYHQAVAVVVAETFEQARAGAALLDIKYETTPAEFDLEAAHDRLSKDDVDPAADTGDFDDAFGNADVKLDETYRTACQSHAMMEPHATVANWEGDKLTVWTSNQMVQWTVEALATTLDMPAENIRVDSPYVGGGFGAKLFLRAECVLAALAARKTGQPVKMMLPRGMVFNNTTHRSATIQRIRIGASSDGKIVALGHDNTSGALPDGSGENATSQTLKFYGSKSFLVRNQVATLGLPESNAMRAPGEASGLMALEIAMDEMAEKLSLDPVEFRIRNDAQVDPLDSGRPFSQRNFVECLKTGAEKFGWTPRTGPGELERDGMWLIGTGVAGAYRGSPATKSGARVRLVEGGKLIVETDMTDIGTGSYTIIAQTAAEMLGLPIEKVDVILGDSAFPVSSGSGGQWGAASSTAGVYAACLDLRKKIAGRLENAGADVSFANGEVKFENGSMPLARIAATGELVGEDDAEFGDARDKYVVSTFGAHFTEVGVHAATGTIRVRRMLAVCDAGRILNPLTARSQVIGAMTMGVGAALMEHLAVDTKRGFFANHDLAGYEVPVHADIPRQEVIFIDGQDPHAGPLQAKGVGELGLCGVSAAIANAVYNATGVRVRDYPVTLDKLLEGLPAV
ncbi:aldehyde oxidoreductase molybdenum-binding subunit PaoC [Henriciella litoralis]|uniref:aldehyde oxidoreductase molybdenum-binding subunit PaoC n=1 Tax=Henriciella litoralis TaxID=568102 RepID=UPI000A06EA9C|nr:aldehyde oxidoreductase molybdenum-binding subunit PaoC [Henriciella litoralis]